MAVMTLEPTQFTSEGHHNNREILKQLEQEWSLTKASCYGVGGAMTSGVGFIIADYVIDTRQKSNTVT